MKIEELNIDEHYKEIGEVLTEEQKKRGLLIYAFQQIQKEYNYLPEDKLKELSKKLDIPLADVYSAASFYKHFYFKPRGKNVVCVCMGTACHVRGASKVLQKLEEEFGVKEGETTEDMSMTLETVGCVGCCGLAPVVTVNEDVVGDVGPKKVNEIINKIKK
ncbi:MAG: NADH-quinone oxidoreductase subunit NuoE [Nitrospirae bacterium]|jgi:NADH:ubiquinone oxidoreductase subunit E|nr:NADH-quinone oxidoreductase subunit NuoE [Nitrospirota bacterium]MCL5062591.1 NADH-quinone oxidoreductase subunit NuoE [Nitrospirota bacterium]MDA8215971.1 NADH-quinone oxidoreductase subunit NuoE [Nitrospiraceae bacterium]MDA8339416.1 NADH-quinone oxidoreductase subunit NuoE [Nitrospiraceae bacterium]